MSAEIALIAGSSVAGAISAAFIERLSRSKRDKKQPRSSGAARAELLSLLFEKNLAAEAITRVYEASQEGRIDRLERDRLLLKYKQQLDSLNQKITHLQPVADFADVTELRNNLVSLLENKISMLDRKILEMKSGVSHDIVDEKVQKIIAETSKIQAAPVEQKPFKAEEKSVDQLQKEIMQALQRLEQVEIDKD
jgi:SOS response regulatory protein OraA/RecX